MVFNNAFLRNLHEWPLIWRDDPAAFDKYLCDKGVETMRNGNGLAVSVYRAALIGAICVLFSVAPASAQSEAESIFKQWFADLREWGATEADYDSLDYTAGSDQLVVRGMRIRLPMDLSIGPAAAKIEIKARSEQVTIDGLQADSEGFQYRKLAFSDGSQMTFSVITGAEANANIKYTFDGYVAENGSWPRLPVLSTDPQKPVSRYFPILRVFRDTALGRARIARLTAYQDGKDQAAVTTTYSDIELAGMVNGRIGSYSLASMQLNMTAPIEGGQMMPITFSTGRQAARNYDIGAFIDAIDPENLVSPQAAKKTSSVVDEISVRDFQVDLPGVIKFKVEEMALTDWRVRPMNRLLPMIDSLLSGGQPDPATITALIDSAVNIYDFGRLEITGTTVQGIENMGGSVKSIRIDKVSREGIGRFLIDRLKVDAGAVTANIGEFSIEEVEFPAFAAVAAAVMASQSGREPTPREVLNVIPMINRIETTDLAFTDPLGRAASLQSYRLVMDRFIDPIPTELRNAVERLRMSVAFAEDDRARKTFEALGYDEITLSQDIDIRWNEDTEELTLDRLIVDFENGGSAELSAVVTGVPRTLFENPELAPMAALAVGFKSAEIVIRDDSLAERLLKSQAQKMQVTSEQLQAQLAATVPIMLAQINNPEFAKKAGPELASFISNPGTLTITARPDAPVPLMQVMQAISSDPSKLPDLLRVEVKTAGR